MARIVFGADFVDEHAVVFSLINANSPLVWDATMLGAARAYAEANQAVMMTPFILAGAMSPVDGGRDLRADARRVARRDGVRASSSGRAPPSSSARSRRSMSMQSGAPTFGTPEPALVLYVMAALARRLGVPFRSGGALTASKIADAQAAYESANTMQPTMLAGVNFVLHAAGWLEGGLAMGYEKFVLDADQLGMWHSFAQGRRPVRERPGDSTPSSRTSPGRTSSAIAHTLANFETAFYRSPLADNSSFEQWESGGRAGRRDARQRDLEADARRVRAAADRRRGRRGAARVDRAAEGLVPGRERVTGAAASRTRARRGARRAVRATRSSRSTGSKRRVLEHVPRDVTLTVTVSPTKGLEPTARAHRAPRRARLLGRAAPLGAARRGRGRPAS